jgi:chromosome segregation ATPase
MKRLIIVLLAVAVTCALPVWAQSDDEKLAEKVFKLEQAFKRVEALVRDLSFQVQKAEGLGNIVREISFEMKQAESMLRDLQNLEKKLSAEIVPRIGNLETSVAGLAHHTKERFDILSSRIFQSEGVIDQLNVRLKGTEDRVRTLLDFSDRVKTIEERVVILEKAIKMPVDPKAADELTLRINELRDRMKALGDVLSGLTNKAIRTEEGLAALQAKLEEQTASMARQEEQLKKVQDESSALKKRLLQAENQIQTNMIVGALGAALGAFALLKAFGIF